LLNLFDVWMVFAVALLLGMTSVAVRSAVSASGGADVPAVLEALPEPGTKVEKVRLTREQLSGEGERLGTAYRLKSGEVVYVPETK
jgi:hypothetical protein